MRKRKCAWCYYNDNGKERKMRIGTCYSFTNPTDYSRCIVFTCKGKVFYYHPMIVDIFPAALGIVGIRTKTTKHLFYELREDVTFDFTRKNMFEEYNWNYRADIDRIEIPK